MITIICNDDGNDDDNNGIISTITATATYDIHITIKYTNKTVIGLLSYHFLSLSHKLG